ncbi:MAG: hypothetical protein HOI74_05255 [Gammaproteobacteria bacterium]|jgi:hypothetical protein|nr:hypothetical protein [Gammaproteobacteria bacterium]
MKTIIKTAVLAASLTLLHINLEGLGINQALLVSKSITQFNNERLDDGIVEGIFKQARKVILL